MKPFFLIVVLFVMANVNLIHSQSLTFSRVLALTRTSATTDTVPAGKVWKIENINVSDESQYYYRIRVNGTMFLLYSDYSYGSNAFHVNHAPTGPIWLPQGATLRPELSGPSYLFSIIEFTVTP